MSLESVSSQLTLMMSAAEALTVTQFFVLAGPSRCINSGYFAPLGL